MQIKNNGQNYAPKGKADKVCFPGEFRIGVIGLAHGHIYGMTNGMTEAGAEIVSVFDDDKDKVNEYVLRYPGVSVAESADEIYDDPSIQMVMSAAVPSDRCRIGIKALESGKQYFVDKPPLTTLEDLEKARTAVKITGRKYAVYYSERRHVEGAVYTQKLLQEKAIGDIVCINGFGPHRASLNTRPDWFFDKNRYGGILTDIGCHQIEQMLIYAGAKNAVIEKSRVGNLYHKDHPGFEDFGDMMLTMDNNVAAYSRLDWFTPDGLGAWGDGRTFIIGTKGYIEIRKYIDVASDKEGDHIYLVNEQGEQLIKAAGTVGFPFFGQLIRDCMDGTSEAYDQDIEFKAIELAISAENMAKKI